MPVRITPFVADAEALIAAGADIVAFDATSRARPQGIADIIAAIHAGGALAMADCSCLEDARAALGLGADCIGSTLSGYIGAAVPDEPDFALVAAMRNLTPFVIAEGRIRTPQQATEAIRHGAYSVVAGSAITRTEHVTSWFSEAIREAAGFDAAADVSHTVLAIDIGGTKILAALIKDSQILRETEFRTDPGLGPDGWIDAIADQVTGWRGDYGQVAVAATGLINQGRWSALNPATLAIPDAYPLVDRLTDKFDIAALAIDSPAYRSALELYNTLYQAGASPKASLSYEYAETNAAFASGQTATALQWNAAASELTDPAKSPAIAEEVGIAAPPSGPAGRADHIHGLGLGLNKNAKNKPGAVKFLAWLASEDAALLYARMAALLLWHRMLSPKLPRTGQTLPSSANMPAPTAAS
jgi:Putative N-acetylmannosamine-6-phosphate epimerase/Bacterial extracellular solute-binding protein/ROK family